MKKLFLALSCLLLGLSACGSQEKGMALEAGNVTEEESVSSEQTEEDGVEEMGILSQFSAVDLDGNEVTQEILQGYPLTMVNVWATFCGPCINEMPELGELAEEYREKGIQIIGMVSDSMSTDGSPDAEQMALAKEIAEETGANYTHIVPGEDLYGLLYQISSVPTTFFVDETGKQVGTAYLGAKDKESWQEIMDEMLAETENAS